MYCPQCGIFNPDDAAFCGTCGTPMKAGVANWPTLQSKEAKWRKFASSPLMLACAVAASVLSLVNLYNLFEFFRVLPYYELGDPQQLLSVLYSIVQPLALVTATVGVWLLYAEGWKTRPLNTTCIKVLLAGSAGMLAAATINLLALIMAFGEYIEYGMASAMVSSLLGYGLVFATFVLTTILLYRCRNDVLANPGDGLLKGAGILFIVEGSFIVLAMLMNPFLNMGMLSLLACLISLSFYFLVGSLLFFSRKLWKA